MACALFRIFCSPDELNLFVIEECRTVRRMAQLPRRECFVFLPTFGFDQQAEFFNASGVFHACQKRQPAVNGLD
jgi:hypothetical protein